MKLEYRLGNLLDHPGRYLLQGCNAQGQMNSGVAKAIRDRYPEVYAPYRKIYEEQTLFLGSVVTVDCGRHVIFNGITQEFYGRDGQKYVDDQAVLNVMLACQTKHHDIKGDNPDNELAMPMIGAGLGGGDWLTIKYIIEATTVTLQPVVYIEDEEKYHDTVAKYPPGF